VKIDYITIFCTSPDLDTARKISEELVQSRLAACCNILPGIQSIYHWENILQQDDELLILIKTRSDIFSEVERKIKDIHPYSVPEIIALPLIHGNVEYLNWMDDNVKK
jgi:periplasmic divalent cation tolerance protein